MSLAPPAADGCPRSDRSAIREFPEGAHRRREGEQKAVLQEDRQVLPGAGEVPGHELQEARQHSPRGESEGQKNGRELITGIHCDAILFHFHASFR